MGLIPRSLSISSYAVGIYFNGNDSHLSNVFSELFGNGGLEELKGPDSFDSLDESVDIGNQTDPDVTFTVCTKEMTRCHGDVRFVEQVIGEAL